MLEDRDLARVDILGGPGTCFERFVGRTLLAAALSDVVLIRAAERARPRQVEAAEATVPVVLQQMTDLLRDMAGLFGEQQEELRRLHGEREVEPVAA
jgi:hypothetical protein